MSDSPVLQISADDARRAARNIAVLVAASILSKGILFFWQIALGTWLGALDYGIYNTVIGLFAIGTSLASFGIGMIAIREVASQPAKIGQYATSMLFIQTLLASLAYLSVVLAAAWVSDNPATLAFTAIAGLSLLIDTLGNIANDLLVAQERMLVSSSVDIAHILLRVALSGVALYLGWGLMGIYLVSLLTGLVRAALLWGVQIRSGLRLVFPLDWSITKPLLLNAAPIAMTSFLYLAYKNADKLMTTRFIGELSTGVLGPATLIDFGVTELLSTTVLTAMYPLLARYHDGKGETFGFLVEKLARFMLIGALPIALMVTIFADEFIHRVYPPEYEASIALLRMIIWYTLLTMVGNVFSKALLIQNRQRLTLGIRTASLILNIILNAILLWRFRDPRGAIAASIAAEALALLLMAGSFRANGFDWGRVLPASLRVLLIGGLVAAVMVIVGLVHPLLGLGLGAVAYLSALLYGGVFSADDWDLLYRLVAALPFGAVIRRYWKRDVALHW